VNAVAQPEVHAVLIAALTNARSAKCGGSWATSEEDGDHDQDDSGEWVSMFARPATKAKK